VGVQVPFLDLKAQYVSMKEEIDSAIQEVLDGTSFAGGPFVSRFETEFARYCQTDYAVGVGSGTEALWMALLALGIGPGDEVITVPNTFIATAEAISFCGARPVFVDIDERTCTMDPNRLEDYLKKRLGHSGESNDNSAFHPATRPPQPFFQSSVLSPQSSSRPKAIIPVHLYGQTADMASILELAEKYDLKVIEDACQAHGAEYKGKRAGSFGGAGCFSFYPGKNLGAYGEAGAVVTHSRELAEKMRIFRDHGQPRRYYHDVVGWNGRMDGFQGAVLSVKLKYLEKWNHQRREKADRYRQLLSGVRGVVLPVEADYARHVYHLYPVRVVNRDQVLKALDEKGISCGIHYPLPIHLQEAYKVLAHKPGDFPVTERVALELLSLPIYPELTTEQIEYVADNLKEIIS
jgi:dTDP-4-amino-4,6-dideoxygalactose transaminase